MPAVVFAGQLGGALLQVTVPVHWPGSLPVGTQTGQHESGESSHWITHWVPGEQSTVSQVWSGTQVG
jgi:hypothetical protein